MALLFMDGFSGGDSQYKWDNGSVNVGGSTASPRVAGGYSGDIGGVNTLFKTVTPSAQLFVGIGLRTDTDARVSFFGDGGATTHITVIRNSSTGRLEIRRGTGSGTLLATGAQPLFDLAWNYVEISVTISDTVGTVSVRINGQTTDEVSYSGDTKNGGTSTNLDRITVYSGDGSVQTTHVTDVYILNSLGSTNNTFLGDVAVRTLVPSGNGTDSQLTGSDANQVDNYLLVDERPYSSADYTGSSTPGLRDTYAMANLTAGINTVYGVQLNGIMAKSDVSLGTSKLVMRSGGTLYDGATRALNTTYTGYYDLYENNPNTTIAWTVSDVNGIEAGMEVV